MCFEIKYMVCLKGVTYGGKKKKQENRTCFQADY